METLKETLEEYRRHAQGCAECREASDIATPLGRGDLCLTGKSLMSRIQLLSMKERDGIKTTPQP
jgi:hypothetical protein